MNTAVLYIHGKGGNADEAMHYAPLFPEHTVIGMDYKSETPWEAETEFPAILEEIRKKFDSVILIANSIGAYFAMQSLCNEKIQKAFFISPIVDMEKLICDMMRWAGVTEDKLRSKGTIETNFGETLSWEYLAWVRAHPVRWDVNTEILYGGRDNLTSRETIQTFSKRIDANLTVMEQGEHWFHTDEQMAFLDRWIAERKACHE